MSQTVNGTPCILMTKTHSRHAHRRIQHKTAGFSRQNAKNMAVTDSLITTDDQPVDDFDYDALLEIYDMEEAAGMVGSGGAGLVGREATGRKKGRANTRPRRAPAAHLSSPDFNSKATRKTKATRALPPAHANLLKEVLAGTLPGLVTRLRKLVYSILGPDVRRQDSRKVPRSSTRVGPDKERLQAAIERARALAAKIGPVQVTKRERSTLRDIKRDLYAPEPRAPPVEGLMNSAARRRHVREARFGAAPPAPVVPVAASPPTRLQFGAIHGAPLYNPVGLLKELADRGWPRATYHHRLVPDRPAHDPLYRVVVQYRGTRAVEVLSTTKKYGETLVAHYLIGNHSDFPEQLLRAILVRQTTRARPGYDLRAPTSSIVANLHLPAPTLNGAAGEATGTDDHPCLNKGGQQNVAVDVRLRGHKRGQPLPDVTRPGAGEVILRDTAHRASQLNGAQGEVTGTDDGP